MGDRDEFLAAVARGDPVPPVDPADLMRYWSLVQEVRQATGDAGTIGTDVNILANEFSPHAPLYAIWFRAGMLYAMIRQGLVSDPQRAGGLDESIFRAAARFRLMGLRLDPDTFLEELKLK